MKHLSQPTEKEDKLMRYSEIALLPLKEIRFSEIFANRSAADREQQRCQTSMRKFFKPPDGVFLRFRAWNTPMLLQSNTEVRSNVRYMIGVAFDKLTSGKSSGTRATVA